MTSRLAFFGVVRIQGFLPKIAVAILISGLIGSGNKSRALASPLPADEMPIQYEFRDSKEIVEVHGTRWVFLFPKDGVSGSGPGAIAKCVAKLSTCVVTQFYDGGATREEVTYDVIRWNDNRIEAEHGRSSFPTASLSEDERRELMETCIIINREKRQLFVARKKPGQDCNEIDNKLQNRFSVIDAKQLCSQAKQNNSYECPNPPRPTDKHGKTAPTPTYHFSDGATYCENWTLNSAGEWENHVKRCQTKK